MWILQKWGEPNVRLRVWKTKLLLEPPPLVQVKIPEEPNSGSYEYGYDLKKSDEQSADSKAQELAKRMQFTKRANISSQGQLEGLDLRRERRGPRVFKRNSVSLFHWIGQLGLFMQGDL
eukprot:gb/GECG01010122.1/.p1 GENE.gb/GECG01010122.1/~~gb/GECG01010122.1/.p1  ORF type:complete len:119 (+),score=15.10 gb/GECG01010122.1/:1-357(+)